MITARQLHKRFLESLTREALVQYALQHANGHRRKGELSPREFQIALLIGNGLYPKQIAADLDLSKKTVSTYVTRIYDYFGIRNPVLIAHKLISLKIIKPIP